MIDFSPRAIDGRVTIDDHSPAHRVSDPFGFHRRRPRPRSSAKTGVFAAASPLSSQDQRYARGSGAGAAHPGDAAALVRCRSAPLLNDSRRTGAIKRRCLYIRNAGVYGPFGLVPGRATDLSDRMCDGLSEAAAVDPASLSHSSLARSLLDAQGFVQGRRVPRRAAHARLPPRHGGR
jgi:hypothetical protein